MDTSVKTVKTTFRISAEAHQMLVRLSKESGVTMQEFVEQLILSHSGTALKTSNQSGGNTSDDIRRTVKKLEKDTRVILESLNSMLVELNYNVYHSTDDEPSPIVEKAYSELSNRILEQQTKNLTKDR